MNKLWSMGWGRQQDTSPPAWPHQQFYRWGHIIIYSLQCQLRQPSTNNFSNAAAFEAAPQMPAGLPAN